METDLPDLCVRVWGKVPGAGPVSFAKDYDGPWTSAHSGIRYGNDEAASMIQAACLRWLLEQDYLYIYPPGPSKEYCVGPDSEAAWSAANADLTTCLLLAVERCHEYKNKENK